MEHLKYLVEDKTIAELLGVQNFTNENAAILELVKNAYDARAKKVTIEFNADSITIFDDGDGMNDEDIKSKWMLVGKSTKKYSTSSDASDLPDTLITETRVLSGSKGIGRFAIARLGAHATLCSVKPDSNPIKWVTDWHSSTLTRWENPCKIIKGTLIKITVLREKWTSSRISSLVGYLSLCYNDDKMEILISPTEKEVLRYFADPILGKNFSSKINLKYDSKTTTLKCHVLNDEFIKGVQPLVPTIDINDFNKSYNIYDEFQNSSRLDLNTEELLSELSNLGDFSAEFYFSLKSSTKTDAEYFMYKNTSLPYRYNEGIVLYRNAFSISSFEGRKDWLGFGKRMRQSPAAASHQTGTWRVRENQISGKIHIDKKQNINLKELANRQGLEEDIYYSLFTKIILVGISAFERYRQSIIRGITKAQTPKKDVTTTPTLIDVVIKDPRMLESFATSKTDEFVTELAKLANESSENKKSQETTKEQYRYDVRILNVLATLGLKATSIAHDLKNDRNNINVNYDFIVSALKEYDVWDTLNLEENTTYSYNNVPLLLSKNRTTNEKLLAFLNTMLDEVEKKRFFGNQVRIDKLLETIVEGWERDHTSLCINTHIDSGLVFFTSEDVFTVILDNLILNSLQQNPSYSKLDININLQLRNDSLEIVYQDYGDGLPQKYLNDPMRILEVHETSRENGHGLGMWIVNNTIQMTNGFIEEIDGTNGFMIKYNLGGSTE